MRQALSRPRFAGATELARGGAGGAQNHVAPEPGLRDTELNTCPQNKCSWGGPVEGEQSLSLSGVASSDSSDDGHKGSDDG